MTAHPLKLDHLVIAARTLEEGAHFVAAKFGVEPLAGGAHPLMGTHNRLLNLWGGAYLEVIAVDPAAAPREAPRPRLFALDDPAMHERLASGPQLVHWVARVDRPKSLTRWRAQYPERIAPVVAMSRGGNTWNLTVPDDGAFPAWQAAGDGVLPSLIQWDTPRHPSDALPATGILLRALTGFHPNAEAIAEQLAWLGASHLLRVESTAGAPVLVAEFELPDGSTLVLGEAAETAQSARRAQPAAKRRRGKTTIETEPELPLSHDTPDGAPDALH
ncbi:MULTISPECIES: VOC family protein [unclassified Caballeronia]|uniref:VOC family protein n=1 Tax=unclassified Caballeronia TaxID=2646786 RepID=UPI002862F114|nr:MULTISPECIES: VOC family protein [unclassified Caballeronia]MDR5738849.1 VOC family protein [Caballeronia sp. LZ016]MDR5811283.1 VOC family protein [Caballeronia sp. LZ019]